MRVIVCGAGQVGSSIARQLAGEHNDVTVIDNDPVIMQKLSDSAEVRCLVGGASLPDVLDEAGAKNTDMLIAVTYSDEVNMVACQVAHSTGAGRAKKIPRLRRAFRHPSYNATSGGTHVPF